MQRAVIKTSAPGTSLRNASGQPLFDGPTVTSIIKLSNGLYLIREREDNGRAIGVVGRWIRGSKHQDTLQLDKNKGEFVHAHASGYFYLLSRVDPGEVEGIIAERNAHLGE
jgi:hypothetical protein